MTIYAWTPPRKGGVRPASRYCGSVVKLADVAREAGVGYGTASRALSGRGPVDHETRKRVKEAAQRLGYRPDATARALREGRTRTVGLVVPDIVNEFYNASAEVLQRVLDEADHRMIVATTGNDPAEERRALQAMLDRNVDGIVHVPACARPELAGTVPVVELNRHSDLGRPAVISDDVAGIRALTELAIRAGHTDIAVINGPVDHSTSRDRLAGFRQAAEAGGLQEGGPAGSRFRVIVTDFSAAGGASAFATLREEPPTALFALSSRLVVGALRAARTYGVRIPQDVALAGYGDPDWFEVWGDGITTYAPPLEAMGARAGALLLKQLRGEKVPAEVVRLRGEVRVRGSLAGPQPTAH